MRSSPRVCDHCDRNMLRTTYLSFVCPDCGSEDFTDMYHESVQHGVCKYAQLQNTYSRQTRFLNYMNNVTGLNFGPAPLSPIWDKMVKCSSMDDILIQVSNLDVKAKHYECLHSYAQIFYEGYTRPPRLTIRETKNIKNMFADILHAYNNIYGAKTVFFSYPWLLYTIFSAMGKNEYLPFIKNLKCKKRSASYLIKFQTCITHIEDNEKYMSVLCPVMTNYINSLKNEDEKKPCSILTTVCTVV